MSEGEFLDITEIKRQQAKDYECITNNGVAPPDQHKVKVTVNCEYLWRERERECEWERPHLITLKIIYNPSVHIIYVFHSIKKQCFFRHSCICSEYNSVGRGTGPQQMDLDWSRSWLVTALLLLYCMLSDPPMITDMKNMPAHLGKTAILRCEAMAVPPAAFEWYRDEHRWTSVPDTFVFKDRNDRRGEV